MPYFALSHGSIGSSTMYLYHNFLFDSNIFNAKEKFGYDTIVSEKFMGFMLLCISISWVSCGFDFFESSIYFLVSDNVMNIIPPPTYSGMRK